MRRIFSCSHHRHLEIGDIGIEQPAYGGRGNNQVICAGVRVDVISRLPRLIGVDEKWVNSGRIVFLHVVQGEDERGYKGCTYRQSGNAVGDNRSK